MWVTWLVKIRLVWNTKTDNAAKCDHLRFIHADVQAEILDSSLLYGLVDSTGCFFCCTMRKKAATFSDALQKHQPFISQVYTNKDDTTSRQYSPLTCLWTCEILLFWQQSWRNTKPYTSDVPIQTLCLTSAPHRPLVMQVRTPSLVLDLEVVTHETTFCRQKA